MPELHIPDYSSIFRAYQDAVSTREKNEMLGLQREAMKRKLADERATREALSAYFGGGEPTTGPAMQPVDGPSSPGGMAGQSPRQRGSISAIARANPEMALDVAKLEAVAGKHELSKAKQALDYGLAVLPFVRPDTYPAFRNDMINNKGLDASVFPESFGSPQEFEDWRRSATQQGMSAKDAIDIQLKTLELGLRRSELKKPSYHSYPQGEEIVTTRYTPGGGEVIVGRGVKPGEQELEIDLGDRKIRVGRGGRLSSGDVSGATGMAKPTEAFVEKELITSSGKLADLVNVAKSYKDEYQTYEGKIKGNWIDFKNNLPTVFGAIPEEERKWRDEMVDYVQKAAKVMAESYHEIAGAALTNTEREMYGKSLIDVDKDAPIAARRKITNLLAASRKATARLNYLRKNGFSIRRALDSGNVPDLDSPEVRKELDSEILSRAVAIERSLDASGVPLGSPQNQEMTQRQLAEEFGLMY